jgi:hypothetical protein
LRLYEEAVLRGEANQSLVLGRGFGFSEIDRMISLPLLLTANGRSACATAAAMSFSTSGRANVATDSILIKRFWLPLPRNSLCGSGSEDPW